MKITTIEATVENGKVILPENVHLPEKAKVYVVVPGFDREPAFHIESPRLAHPEQASDFIKEVIEETDNAVIQ